MRDEMKNVTTPFPPFPWEAHRKRAEYEAALETLNKWWSSLPVSIWKNRPSGEVVRSRENMYRFVWGSGGGISVFMETRPFSFKLYANDSLETLVAHNYMNFCETWFPMFKVTENRQKQQYEFRPRVHMQRLCDKLIAIRGNVGRVAADIGAQGLIDAKNKLKHVVAQREQVVETNDDFERKLVEKKTTLKPVSRPDIENYRQQQVENVMQRLKNVHEIINTQPSAPTDLAEGEVAGDIHDELRVASTALQTLVNGVQISAPLRPDYEKAEYRILFYEENGEPGESIEYFDRMVELQQNGYLQSDTHVQIEGLTDRWTPLRDVDDGALERAIEQRVQNDYELSIYYVSTHESGATAVTFDEMVAFRKEGRLTPSTDVWIQERSDTWKPLKDVDDGGLQRAIYKRMRYLVWQNEKETTVDFDRLAEFVRTNKVRPDTYVGTSPDFWVRLNEFDEGRLLLVLQGKSDR